MKKILIFLTLSFSIFFTNAEIQYKSDSVSYKNDTSASSEIFDRAEVMPSFPGGVAELMKYLSENIQYPVLARKNGLEGKVLVKFYIDVDGEVSEPVILRDGVGGGCAEESIGVISSMPKWSPGIQKGKMVRVYYVLPITFKLTSGKLKGKMNTTSTTKMDSAFQGGDTQLEFYKQEILSKIIKSEKEKSQKTVVEVMVNFDGLGKVSSVFVIRDNTDNLDNINIIIEGIKAIPKWNWYPTMKSGKLTSSQKILIFEY